MWSRHDKQASKQKKQQTIWSSLLSYHIVYAWFLHRFGKAYYTAEVEDEKCCRFSIFILILYIVTAYKIWHILRVTKVKSSVWYIVCQDCYLLATSINKDAIQHTTYVCIHTIMFSKFEEYSNILIRQWKIHTYKIKMKESIDLIFNQHFC